MKSKFWTFKNAKCKIDEEDPGKRDRERVKSDGKNMTSWKSVVNVFIGEGSDFLCQMSRRDQVREHRRQKEKNMLQSYFNTILVIL